ncbi:hypothetical protein [Streptomyces sp. NPDC004629]|uniref:hypothetical protein n=1 Tax=Streptomyces sp. NPDC004629 TaxID=3364705 RepID=UPI0036D07B76
MRIDRRDGEREILYFPRARVAPIAVALVMGAALGVIGPLAGKFDNAICHAVALVFSGGWSWACFAFLVGYSRRSKIESSLLASSALAIGVVVYYLFKFLTPTAPVGRVISAGSGEDLTSRILFWGIAAFVAGAPVGLVGNLGRTSGIGGLPFRLLVPLIAFIETSQRLSVEADSQGLIVDLTWNAIRVVAVVAALALVGHTMWTWRTRRSRPECRSDVGASAKRV